MPPRLAAAGAVAATAVAFALYSRFTWPWLVLGWVGLVPWLGVLDRATSPRGALAAGLVMSVAFVLAVFGWFARAIATYTGAPIVIGVVVLVVAAPLLQPQLVTFALARQWMRRARGFWPTTIAGAGVYVGTEWASGKLFGDTLGYGLYPSVWMRQGADAIGVGGLTFVLVVANECVRSVLVGPGRRGRAACVVALAVGLLVYGAVRCRQLAAGGHAAPVTAGLVQADLSRYERLAADAGTYAAVRRILDTHVALSTEILDRARVDFLVWPETVYPTTFGAPKSADGAAFDREIAAFVAYVGVPLVFGAYDREDGHEFNAAIVLEPAAHGPLAFDAYRKASLFPFTERVPALLDAAAVRGWLPWLGTWTPGDGPRVLPIALADGRTLRVAPLICYDVLVAGNALAAARAGAEVIVTLSNDSWLDAGSGPRLHLVGAAFRSIETRRPQVRATNTGISAVIDATGELLETAGVHERATLIGTVTPAPAARPLVVRWGDWFGPAALALGVGLLLVRLQQGGGCAVTLGTFARARGGRS